MQHCKIVCVGQNYRAHAEEMRSVPPAEPMLFLKPSSAIIGDGETIEAPDVGRVDHEVELALVIGRSAHRVREEDALSHVSHVAVFNDVTARDMQTAARRAGNPWTLAKGMDTFAPMSRPVPLSRVKDVHDLDLELRVNGEVRQRGNTSDMVFSPEKLVVYISRFMTLEPGDIIATGTPEGVSALQDGDRVEATIPGVGVVRNLFRRV
ncbi:MAG: fumarylacetoacetate hydrolase family protein [Methanomassiliicoccus sp.]|nr:fumarylacetoacetate hydrolase family protein [Methanomassiliicoccus sp.]